ncbi:MAG: hypothetical protein ACU0CO_01165 [Shimia sp.]
MASEADMILLICGFFLKGEPERRVAFGGDGDAASYVRVDCETEDLVIEVGLDRRSSLDSVHQAQFAAVQTGKQPLVIIVDTDGRLGTIEYQIETVADSLGIPYQRLTASFLQRYAMTSYLRDRATQPGEVG